MIEEITTEKWVSSWESSDDYRQSKFFLSGPSKSRSQLLLQNNREALGHLIRFITGHAFLKRQNAVVFHGISPPPGDVTCRLCEDPFSEETPHHLITECDALCHWRAETLGGYVLDEFPEWDPRNLVQFIRHKEIILLETDD